MRLNNDKYFEILDQKTFQQRLINVNELKNEISVEDHALVVLVSFHTVSE